MTRYDLNTLIHSSYSKYAHTYIRMNHFMNNQKVQRIQFTPSSVECAHFANVFFGNVLRIQTLIAYCKGQQQVHPGKVINKQIQRQRPQSHIHTHTVSCIQVNVQGGLKNDRRQL